MYRYCLTLLATTQSSLTWYRYSKVRFTIMTVAFFPVAPNANFSIFIYCHIECLFTPSLSPPVPPEQHPHQLHRMSAQELLTALPPPHQLPNSQECPPNHSLPILESSRDPQPAWMVRGRAFFILKRIDSLIHHGSVEINTM